MLNGPFSLCFKTRVHLNRPKGNGLRFWSFRARVFSIMQLFNAYDKYISKGIIYEKADVMKVQIFFTGLEQIEEQHQEASRLLVRLREDGYVLPSLRMARPRIKRLKIKLLGYATRRMDFHLRKSGCCKPDCRIFQSDIETLNASSRIHMVGDSADSDIKGALNAGLSAILYSPIAQESQRFLFGTKAPVIHYVGQLLEHLGIAIPGFEPCFASQGS
ncbi:hypothetical protein BDZ45DRAFT_746296 [Acephala macrosclerotiorum]|nr:hypothetical protein BDZ45DRAFT_746296 [Acephala macrosclerotiorum]